MFKAILHEKQIPIVLLWSGLIFIGYNVLTVAVEATESNDKKVCEDYNGKWKSIGGGDKGCVFEKDKDREKYSIRPWFGLSAFTLGIFERKISFLLLDGVM